MSAKLKAWLGVLALSSFILYKPPAATAQDAPGIHLDTGANKMLNSRDTAFAMKAAQSGMAEVKMGKLAAAKASDPDVKTFGREMVENYTKANDRLASVARQENMTLPNGLTAKDEAMYNHLESLSGAAFDKAYVADMLKNHKEDVKEFQKEARTGKDQKIKNFAEQTLPVLESHLEKITSIHSKVASSSSI